MKSNIQPPRIGKNPISVAYKTKAVLGEGAFWDHIGQRLLWVDILEAKIFVGSENAYHVHRLPVMATAIWKVYRDRIYLATDEGIGELNLETGCYRTLVEVEANNPATRSNDGCMAPDGSFWFGTMLREPHRKGGAIYRVTPDMAVEQVARPVGIPNTFVFPAGGSYALIGDSFDRQISRHYIHNGVLAEAESWLTKARGSTGVPDGSALVGDVAVINAEWDGGRLVAYDLRGKEYDTLDLPVPRPTSCTLGGLDGRVLYVTTAREGLTKADLESAPLSGAVFAVHLNSFDVRGQ